jgi:hypothetical protein
MTRAEYCRLTRAQKAEVKARPCECGQPRRKNQPTCADCYKPRTGGHGGRKSDAEFNRILQRLDLVNPKRCRCGLILPCYQCIPTSEELATARVSE